VIAGNQEPKVKRIINGITYNTDTSVRIARKDGEYSEGPYCTILYKTRGGAYFLDQAETVLSYDQETAETRVVDRKRTFVPMSRDDAEEWYLEGETEVLVEAFAELPEAAAEAETEAGVYLRLPMVLKTRIEAAAKNARLSLNAWAMRCFERCAGSDRPEGSPTRPSRPHLVTSGPKGPDPV
jgi:predicted HicB family RNase H-like nuclease